MTRVDFYVLKAGSARQRSVFACRLTEKALWTFKDGSFVPHLELDQSADNNSDDDTPVHIGHGSEPGHHADLLINLADDVPLFFSRFERVAEIVAADSRDLARDRFRFYRDRGYALETHNL
jgi:DNA polymerase-3 subunit chi